MCRGLWLLAVLSALDAAAATQYDWVWRPARATAFGADASGHSFCPLDQHDISCWSIHKGNCGFGYVFPSEPSGWDVAAISDVAGDFAGSCGRCVEVKCSPSQVRDGFGAEFDRYSACRDPDASLVVRIVDACQCHYAANPYSNKRWCCGDSVYHFDLSVWAFEKLADLNLGVIGLQYRAVPCNYSPWKQAQPPTNPIPGQSPPAGAINPVGRPDINKAPSRKWSPQQSDFMYEPFKSWSTELAAVSGPVTPADSLGNGAVQGSQPGVVFDQVLQNGWWDRSWGVRTNWVAGTFGTNGENVACVDIAGTAAFSVAHIPGAFQGMSQLEFWVLVDHGTPRLTVNLSSDQRSCSPAALQQLPAYESKSGWNKFNIQLNQFAGGGTGTFNGCGGLGYWDVTNIDFKAVDGARQSLCISALKLLA